MPLISRRFFCKSIILGGAITSTSYPPFAVADVQANIISVKDINFQTNLYHGWPTLTSSKNGELMLVYSGGRESHVCPFGRVEYMQSRNGGQTWSFPRTLLDGPIDDRDAGILETNAGTLLVTTFSSLAYATRLEKAENIQSGNSGSWAPVRLKRWKAVHNRLNAQQRKVQLGVWMIRSTDGGLTWSKPYDSLVNSPHGPIQLNDGRILYAGKDLWRKGNRVGVCESIDDGETWSWLAEIPVRKGDSHTNYHELHMVEANNGSLVVHIRNHNSANSREILQSESIDGGKTWTVPHSIDVWGLPSHLLKLKDGRLLMSYGYRRKPFGIQARVSNNHGQTWSDQISISTDGFNGDLGYPSTVQLKDNTLLTIWYEKKANSAYAVLRQAHWKLK